jgi:hypothetical protein
LWDKLNELKFDCDKFCEKKVENPFLRILFAIVGGEGKRKGWREECDCGINSISKTVIMGQILRKKRKRELHFGGYIISEIAFVLIQGRGKGKMERSEIVENY